MQEYRPIRNPWSVILVKTKAHPWYILLQNPRSALGTQNPRNCIGLLTRSNYEDHCPRPKFNKTNCHHTIWQREAADVAEDSPDVTRDVFRHAEKAIDDAEGFSGGPHDPSVLTAYGGVCFSFTSVLAFCVLVSYHKQTILFIGVI